MGEQTYTAEQMFAFLLGEAPLDGLWFDDEPLDKRGPYWWRSHLRQAAQMMGMLIEAAQIEQDARDAERWRHVRSTAFREFDAEGMWLRFAAIRHYEGPSDRLNVKFVDGLVDDAREHAMAKESGNV